MEYRDEVLRNQNEIKRGIAGLKAGQIELARGIPGCRLYLMVGIAMLASIASCVNSCSCSRDYREVGQEQPTVEQRVDYAGRDI